eukprot:1587697-Rhodomonas_salina.2
MAATLLIWGECGRKADVSTAESNTRSRRTVQFVPGMRLIAFDLAAWRNQSHPGRFVPGIVPGVWFIAFDLAACGRAGVLLLPKEEEEEEAKEE